MSNPDIITQVTPEQQYAAYAQQQYYDDGSAVVDEDVDMQSLIRLNIRGELFEITRDQLMNLPESILLCLFPNGVFLDVDGNVITNLTEEDVVYVNFSPECFSYIISSFEAAARRLPATAKIEIYDNNKTPDASVLNEKPSIIVLREDLDYYVIPPRKGITEAGIAQIKKAAGSYLVGRTSVFEGLGYGHNKALGPAEEHLLEMLCSSGFQITSEWGHRSCEPGKTVLTSLSLMDLKSPQQQQHQQASSAENSLPGSPSLGPVMSNSSTTNTTPRQSRKSRIATLAHTARSVSRNRSRSKQKSATSNPTVTKLLLFWKKPARKCWWSSEVVELTVPLAATPDTPAEQLTVHVHIRRVWTLELSVIGVH